MYKIYSKSPQTGRRGRDSQAERVRVRCSTKPSAKRLRLRPCSARPKERGKRENARIGPRTRLGRRDGHECIRCRSSRPSSSRP